LLKAVVEDATVENGILTVPILVHKDLYDMNDFAWGNNSVLNFKATPDDDEELLFQPTASYEKNISVVLQVKNKNMDAGDDTERLIVSSQYVRTQLSLLFSRIELIRDGDMIGKWSNVLPSHMANDIVLDTYYKPSTTIELWNGYNRNTRTYDRNYSINLNDSVRAIAKFNGIWRVLEQFGYDNIEDHFVFELIDVENEGVNQSSYVNLNGATGELSVKPGSNNNANQAAVGRTPVVLVKVVQDGNVYAAGYIKIVITEEVDNSPVPFAFTLEDYTLDCNSEYSLTDIDLTNIDFDQIFDHERIMLGKDAFFTAYRSNGPIETEVISKPDLATGNEISFEWNITEPTQGGNLANYIEGTIANTAPAGTYVVKTTLQGEGIQPDVEITWTVTVKLPSYRLTANTAFWNGNNIIVNPTIMEQGGKTSAAYEALLNNAFMHSAFDFTFTPLPEACEEYLTPYFVFTSAPSGYVIAADGTELRQGSITGLLAAKIETDPSDNRKYFVRLNDDIKDYPGASWGNYTPLSEASKGLVGKTVSVQPRGYINGATYNWINLYDPFNVTFTYPLKLVLPADAAVYDQANQGLNVYTFNPYDPTTALVDWNPNPKELNITTEEGRALINHYEVGTQPVPGTVVITDWTFAGYTTLSTPASYWRGLGAVNRPGHLGWWYEPVTAPTITYHSPFVFDTDNATCNIQSDGTIGGNIDRPIPFGMQLKYGVVAAGGYTTVIVGGTTVNIPTTYSFTWLNGATGAIVNEFKVAVPVSVTHKWGVLRGKLIITVKPGSGPAPEV
jgi:hypothetical protein